MKTLQGEQYQPVLKLPEGIEIRANVNNWLLITPPRNYWFYPTLDFLFADLLNYKIKVFAIQGVKKDIASLKESIRKAREEVLTIMRPLITLKDGV